MSHNLREALPRQFCTYSCQVNRFTAVDGGWRFSLELACSAAIVSSSAPPPEASSGTAQEAGSESDTSTDEGGGSRLGPAHRRRRATDCQENMRAENEVTEVYPPTHVPGPQNPSERLIYPPRLKGDMQRLRSEHWRLLVDGELIESFSSAIVQTLDEDKNVGDFVVYLNDERPADIAFFRQWQRMEEYAELRFERLYRDEEPGRTVVGAKAAFPTDDLGGGCGFQVQGTSPFTEEGG